jgi:hypothetical protein
MWTTNNPKPIIQESKPTGKGKIFAETFGGYSDSPEEIFKEALTWIQNHLEVQILDVLMYCDEGRYMTIYYFKY